MLFPRALSRKDAAVTRVCMHGNISRNACHIYDSLKIHITYISCKDAAVTRTSKVKSLELYAMQLPVSVQVLFTRLVARGQPIASVVVGHDVDSKLRGEPLAKEFVDADVFCIAMAEEEGEARVLVLDVHQRDGASLRGVWRAHARAGHARRCNHHAFPSLVF